MICVVGWGAAPGRKEILYVFIFPLESYSNVSDIKQVILYIDVQYDYFLWRFLDPRLPESVPKYETAGLRLRNVRVGGFSEALP